MQNYRRPSLRPPPLHWYDSHIHRRVQPPYLVLPSTRDSAELSRAYSAQGYGFVAGLGSPESLDRSSIHDCSAVVRESLSETYYITGSRLSPCDSLRIITRAPPAGHDVAHHHTHMRVREKSFIRNFPSRGGLGRQPLTDSAPPCLGVCLAGSIRGGTAGKSVCGSGGLTCMKDISTSTSICVLCVVMFRVGT